MPPTQLRIATATANSIYFRQEQAYAQRLAAHGVQLEVQPFEGLQLNQAPLRKAVAAADLAFMQSGFDGVGIPLNSPGQARIRFEVLANVSIEAMWILSRAQYR